MVGVGEEGDEGIRQGVLNGVSCHRLDVEGKNLPELEEVNSPVVVVIPQPLSAPLSEPERKAQAGRALGLANASDMNPRALE